MLTCEAHLSSEVVVDSSSRIVFFTSLLGNLPLGMELGICLGGGAEQTGTTVLILTAGARNLGFICLMYMLPVLGRVEYEVTPVLTLGGAGIWLQLVKFCGMGLSEDIGSLVRIITGAAADGGSLGHPKALGLDGYWGMQ